MGKVKQLRRNWSNKNWWKEVAIPYIRENFSVRHIPKQNRHPRVYNLIRNLYFSVQEEPVSVPDADWDNLIILDACRFDNFQEQNTIPGELEAKISKGPQTPIFLEENFGSGNYHDTVVISANPHQKRLLDDSQFHDVHHLWSGGLDSDLKTIEPTEITEATLQAANEYPDKRLLIHYLQPHAPFIGPEAAQNLGEYTGDDETWPYRKARNGEVSKADVRSAYAENLDIVLSHAETLVDELDGKTVVTSDHGELLGHRAWPFPWREYGHPRIVAHDLLKIPWLTVNGDRKRIVEEKPKERDRSEDTSEIEEKLQNLGYR